MKQTTGTGKTELLTFRFTNIFLLSFKVSCLGIYYLENCSPLAGRSVPVSPALHLLALEERTSGNNAYGVPNVVWRGCRRCNGLF